MPSKADAVNKNSNKVNNNFLVKAISFSLLSIVTDTQERLVQKQPLEVYYKKGALRKCTLNI